MMVPAQQQPRQQPPPPPAMTAWEKQRGKVTPTGQIIAPKDTLTKFAGANEKPLEEPPGPWHQSYFKPCASPGIMVYSVVCCCCAMGDIGCYTRKRFYCYPLYCTFAWCPCCLGWARELLAEQYNLVISEIEPEDCTGWIVKFVGFRFFCMVTMCFLPCLHVTQMRAEVAYRRHGKATLCPCCCFECGDRPDVTQTEEAIAAADSPGYPRQPGFGPPPTQEVKGAATTEVVSVQPIGDSKPGETAMIVTKAAPAPSAQQAAFRSPPHMGVGAALGLGVAQRNAFSSQPGHYGQPMDISLYQQQNFASQPGMMFQNGYEYSGQNAMYTQGSYTPGGFTPGGYGVQQQMMFR